MGSTHRPTREKYYSNIGIGPRLAKVVGHQDPEYMGGLYVTLITPDTDSFAEDSKVIPVRYCPPFFGATNLFNNGLNSGNDQAYNDTQKSYGMVFIPPDVGVTVLVIFEEESGEGFWIGCVPDKYINHMVPAIGASTAVDITPAQKADYGNIPLPVAEVNTLLAGKNSKNANDIDAIKKPVHPIAGFMLEQGLLEDDVRGRTSSTMRRNQTPSVFGILTPGPVDKRQNAKKVPVGTSKTKTKGSFVSRVGGTQLVMDDGDERFVRKKPAWEGPPEYADVLKGESGDVRIPISEYFRVRTRTGHQLLLHNSEDLIYIGNSRGTAWIELSSDGKIDIFAADSVSIHTQGDFNLRADRDFNIEAKRNINIRAEGNLRSEIAGNVTSFVTGNVELNIDGNEQKIVAKDSLTSIKGNLELVVGKDQKIKVAASSHLKAGNSIFSTAGNESHFLSTNKHVEYAARVEIKCDPATPAKEPTSAEQAKASEKMSLHDIDVVDASQKYTETRYQSTETIQSIMKRVPMHEPWYQHENVDPLKVKFDKTDRDV